MGDYSPSYESWNNAPADFTPTWNAFQQAILAEKLALRGDLDGAWVALSKGEAEAARGGPEGRAAIEEARGFVTEAAPRATTAAAASASADAAHVLSQTLTEEQRAALERDNALTERAAAVAAAGGDPKLTYGLGIVGQGVADAGSAVTAALGDALLGWSSILGVVGALVVVAVAVVVYVKVKK